MADAQSIPENKSMDMESELATKSADFETLDSTNGAEKREREEGEEEEKEEASKKAKLEEKKSEEGKEEEINPLSAKLGPKNFESGEEMFNYFYKFLHFWPPNVNINKYEHMVLLDLLKKGHTEPDKKIGAGIQSFQIRYHPMWKSRCFFIVRTDDSSDDFSFRKCVEHLLPLPENMKLHSSSDIKAHNGKNSGGHQKGSGGRGGGRVRGHGKRGGFGK